MYSITEINMLRLMANSKSIQKEQNTICHNSIGIALY